MGTKIAANIQEIRDFWGLSLNLNRILICVKIVRDTSSSGSGVVTAYLCVMENSVNDVEYVPGSCNIGAAEIARRNRVGYFGLVCTVFAICCIEMLDADRIWRLTISIPVAITLTGFLQARQKFCLRYGLMGVFSVLGMHNLTAISDSENRQKDRNMALSLVMRTILGTILFSVFYYLLPRG